MYENTNHDDKKKTSNLQLKSIRGWRTRTINE